MKTIGFRLEYEGIDIAVASQKELKEQIKLTKKELADAEKGTKVYDKLNSKLQTLEGANKAVRREQTQLRNEIIGTGKAGGSAYDILSAKLRALKQRAKDLQAQKLTGSAVDPKVLKDAIEEAQKLDAELKQIDKTVGDSFRNVGNYQSAFEGILGNISGGDSISSLLGGDDGIEFSNLGKNLGGAVGAGIAVGLAVEGVGAIKDYTQQVVQEFGKLNKEVSQVLGDSTGGIDAFVVKVKSIADVFSKDTNEVLIAANNFAKQTGISLDRSFDLIEKGFISGADSSGNFLSNLSEYPVQFANAGFSAEDFIKIATQEVRGGFYDDKLLDTIKETDLSLKEVTQTQKDALDLLGTDFSKELQEGLASGAISTQDAFTRIVSQAQEAGLNIQETQVLVADLFKGAGEDAGGFQKVVEAVFTATGRSLQDYIEDTSALNQAQARQLAVQEQLNEANQRLFNIFGEGNVELDNLTTLIKAEFVNALVDVLSIVKDWIDVTVGILKQLGILDQQTTSNIEALEFLAQGIVALVSPISGIIKAGRLFNAVWIEIGQTIGAVNRALVNLDFSGINDQISGFFSRIGVRSGLIEETTESTIGWSDALGIVSDGIKKEADELVKSSAAKKEATKENDNLSNSTKTVKEQTEAAEGSVKALSAIISSLKTQISETADAEILSDLNSKLLQAELNLDNAKVKIDEFKKTAFFDEVGEIGQLAPLDVPEIEALDAPTIPLIAEIDPVSFDEAKEFLAEFRELEKAEQLASIQESLAVAGDFALQATDILGQFLDSASEKRLNRIESEREKELKAVEGNAAAEEEVNKKYDKLREKEEKKAANQRKAIAITESIIATALAVIKALPNIPLSIATGVIGGIQTAAIATQQFAEGGYTGSGLDYVDSTGYRVAGVVHEGEWVAPKWMIEQDPALFDALENKRQGYASGGLVGNVPIPSGAINSSLGQSTVKIELDTAKIGQEIAAVINDNISGLNDLPDRIAEKLDDTVDQINNQLIRNEKTF